MWVIQMLNSNDEWELCHWVFDSADEARSYAAFALDAFDETRIVELKKY